MPRNVPLEHLTLDDVRLMSNQRLAATFRRTLQRLDTAITQQMAATAQNAASPATRASDAATDRIRDVGQIIQAEVLRRMGGLQFRAEDYPGTLYVSNANVAQAQHASGGDVGWVREDPATLQNRSGNVVDKAAALDVFALASPDDTIAVGVLVTPEGDAIVFRTLPPDILDMLLEGEHLMDMVDSIIPWATLTATATDVQYV